MFHVAEFCGAVDHHVYIVARIGDDGIIDDATVDVSDEGETARAGGEAGDVADHYFLEEGYAVFSVPTDLAMR